MGKGKAPSKVEILSRKRLLESYMSVDEVLFRTELLGGGMSDVMDREVVGRGNAASALVRHETSGKLVLIRQFRLPAYEETSSGWILELPAGAIEEGERPDQAIRREIREETGYEARGLAPICSFFVSPGYTTEQMFLFDVTVDGEPGHAPGDGEEDIELVELSPDEAFAMMDGGEINDAKTLVALLWLRGQGAG